MTNGRLRRSSRVRTIALIGATAALLAGCGSSAEPTPIVYERGGGIAGNSLRLEVEPDGVATLTSRQGTEERTEEFELSDDELASVREAVEHADFDALGERLSEDCFDCYGYSLEYGGERASADSATLSDEFSAATEPLHELATERLPPNF